MRELNLVIDLIEERLTQPIDVRELARIALTSEYHFRRMFSTLSGMPLSEYLRRRRLTVAAAEILAGGTVLDVAVRYGYGSAEAFTRAFRQLHGLSPSEARRPGAVLRSQPKLRFHLRIEGSSNMEYRIVKKEAFHLVGFRTRVPLIHLGQNEAIAEFERGLDPGETGRLAEWSDMDPAGTLAVTDNLEEPGTEGSELDYWHAVAATRPHPDFDHLTVSAGQWVVFEAEGKLPEALQWMWADAASGWFPANPYEWAPGPQMLRVEHTPGGEHGRGQLWIPVTPAGPR